MVAIGGRASGVVEYALRGLAMRSDVRADNIANHSTPGYRAKRVDFETVLRTALETGRAPAGEPAVLAHPGLPGPHANTVDLEEELVGSMKDALTRDALVNAYNARIGLLRSAILGR